ncbi:SDR family NAD(P)-dependent oxidoreductase [Sphingobacterium sp. UBA5670]|uniref:SDR family NAD(P)-dependent oxidoreductase n=1 Tax=Sphingobacterium sp. UBA5670 TaxID=1947502 RepID=UPI0025CC19B5|nr:SDR family NAD(P)-dependent oxidoreductase [Sphingobacterium sp. UBA5670]
MKILRNNPNRIIVMTGATSGFGNITVQHLAEVANARVIVGARGENRTLPSGVEVIPVDLASLTSVREFVNAVIKAIGTNKIDILILNAGLHGSPAEDKSEDGYGLTFAVNHLSHYLISRLLLPYMSDNSRMVITSSNMHNPPFKVLAPKRLELDEWSHPTAGGNGTGVRSYIASKLCNLMTALYLSRLKEVKEQNVHIIAFNPGLTGSVVGRDASKLQKAIVKIITGTIFPILSLFKPEFKKNKAEHSGKMLADVALGNIVPPAGKIYVSLVRGIPTYPDPSELASNIELQGKLWEKSAEMVGLKR